MLLLLLAVGGYVFTSRTIDRDRNAAAERRAQVETVHTQEVLGRARAYVAGLAQVLAGERRPSQTTFARWAGGTSASVGLDDVMWVERVPQAGRAAYERRLGSPITRLTASGRLVRAPARRSYLPATFTSGSRPELRRGVDVSTFPGLAPAIRDRASIFAVSATRPGSLGSEPGFYLLEAATYGRAPVARGFLVAFVPTGWFTATLGGDPRSVSISQEGRRVEGDLADADAAATFETLGRNWRIDVAREPPSGLQSALPWLALAWPFAVAGLAFVVARGTARRRRAERDVAQMFELSLDLVGIVGYDGRYRQVNPAFRTTLGYPEEAFIGRPFADFMHPDDMPATREVFASIMRGAQVTQFETRFICADGSVRWLQWNGRAVPDQEVIYGIGRDVTERRRIDAELREARHTAEATGEELRVRVEEQMALRRVATLVARGESPAAILDAVAAEVSGLLDTNSAGLIRYDPDGGTVVAVRGDLGGRAPVGRRVPIDGNSLLSTVLNTGRPARMDRYPEGSLAAELGVRSAVAAPISVEGRLWGSVFGAWTEGAAPLADAESRIAEFTELVATAIANAESREQLAASRARIVTAATEERRRIVRDLHDGAQQRLVNASITLKLALQQLGSDGDAAELLTEAIDETNRATSELRELVHGLLPAVLTNGGLRAAIDALAERGSLPVQVDVTPERFPPPIEATAYFLVSEALTNVAKHADARHAEVTAQVDDGALRVEVRDDGAGGADPSRGSGLTGLRDRVEALGGTIEIASPPGRGTTLLARIPIAGR